MQRLHEWAATTSTGDRDELVPGVGDQAWRQVSVSARECVGVQRCPFGTQCFAELARDEAGRADIVVTNHALLAIDALEDFDVFPEHDVVIIDEAHDLVDRVTSVASDELSAAGIEVAARRCGRMIDESPVARLRDAGAAAERVLAEIPAGRIDVLDEALTMTLESVRDAAAGCAAEFRASSSKSEEEPERVAARRAALAAIGEVADAAERVLGAFGAAIADRSDVVWMDRPAADEPGRPPTLRVAPLRVGGLLASRLFSRRTVVLTSATLALGGSFQPLARQWGLARAEDAPPERPPGRRRRGRGVRRTAFAGLVGHGRGVPVRPSAQRHLVRRQAPSSARPGRPRPVVSGRDRRADRGSRGSRARPVLLDAGSTPGRRGAARTDRCPAALPGRGSDLQLVTQFAADEATCLFGTLSLWQGVDVPGPSLQLVIIDRIPFPRPDDPLASARQRSVAAHGGNGFMSVAATQAALLLAQGAGRLLRTMTDRGVVAVLDPRLSTARYAGFLRASLPPFWTTTDPQVVRGALRGCRLRPAEPRPGFGRLGDDSRRPRNCCWAERGAPVGGVLPGGSVPLRLPLSSRSGRRRPAEREATGRIPARLWVRLAAGLRHDHHTREHSDHRGPGDRPARGSRASPGRRRRSDAARRRGPGRRQPAAMLPAPQFAR